LAQLNKKTQWSERSDTGDACTQIRSIHQGIATGCIAFSKRDVGVIAIVV
jgi:hypothetical protein